MKLILITISLFPFLSVAQLKVADVFSSNMILQRESPVAVWGKAVPGKVVEVRLGTTMRSIVVAKDSSWKLYLPKQQANTQPQSLLISSGDTAVQFQNILIGDV